MSSCTSLLTDFSFSFLRMPPFDSNWAAQNTDADRPNNSSGVDGQHIMRYAVLSCAQTACLQFVGQHILQPDGIGRADRVQKRPLACSARRLSMCLRCWVLSPGSWRGLVVRTLRTRPRTGSRRDSL